MKFLYKIIMPLMVGLYRLTGGRLGGNMGRLKVLLITNKGRRSGRTYVTQLGCFDNERGYVIVASNSGRPSNPAWYYNLKSDPQVTVQVFDKVMPATAEVLTGEARRQAWRQVIATAPANANYEKRTTREIPVILLRPNK